MVTAGDYFVFIQYTAHGKENVHSFLEEEELLNEQLKSTDGVLAMWCFVPKDIGELIPITIFVRLLSIDYLKNVQDRMCRFELVYPGSFFIFILRMANQNLIQETRW